MAGDPPALPFRSGSRRSLRCGVRVLLLQLPSSSVLCCRLVLALCGRLLPALGIWLPSWAVCLPTTPSTPPVCFVSLTGGRTSRVSRAELLALCVVKLGRLLGRLCPVALRVRATLLCRVLLRIVLLSLVIAFLRRSYSEVPRSKAEATTHTRGLAALVSRSRSGSSLPASCLLIIIIMIIIIILIPILISGFARNSTLP